MDSTDVAAARAAKPPKARKPRKWFSNKAIAVILGCGLVGLVLGYFASLTQPYVWQVQATLLAHVGREAGSSRSEIVAAGGSTHIVSTPNTETLNTEIQLLKSPWLLRATWDSIKQELQAAVDEINAKAKREGRDQVQGAGGAGGFSVMGLLNEGITSLYRTLDLAYEIAPEETQFAGWSATLQVTQVPKSNMLLATAISPSPVLAKRSLERWLKMYQDYHLEAFSQKETMPLFDEETVRLTAEVNRIESQLTAFRKEHDVFDIEQAKNFLQGQELRLEDDLRGLATQMEIEETRIAELEARWKDRPDMTLQSSSEGINPSWDMLDKQILEAKTALAKAERDFKDPESPYRRVPRELLDQIVALQSSIERTRDANSVRGRDPIKSDLERDLWNARIAQKANQAREAALKTNLEEVKDELFRLEGLRAQHSTMLDDLAETKKDLAKFKEGARVARLNNTLDEARVTNVRVVSPPSIPTEPVLMLGLPHRVAITGIGGAFGLFAALGLYLLIMSLREAGLLKGGPPTNVDESAVELDELDLGVWAITEDDEDDARRS